MSCYGVDFTSEIWWPYLDCGQPGVEKMFEGFDLVFTGTCTVSFGYDQADLSAVSEEYTVSADDFSAVGMIPYPIAAKSVQLRLSFSGDQAWDWQYANLYVQQEASP